MSLPGPKEWENNGKILPDYISFSQTWSGKAGNGRYWKRQLSKARRRYWKMLLRFGYARYPTRIEREVNYKGW